MSNEAQDYVNEQALKRGYVQEYHKILIANDLEVAEKSNELIDAVFIKDRSLDRKTRELIFVAALTCLRAPHWQIKQHIKIAVDRGRNEGDAARVNRVGDRRCRVRGFPAWSIGVARVFRRAQAPADSRRL